MEQTCLRLLREQRILTSKGVNTKISSFFPCCVTEGDHYDPESAFHLFAAWPKLDEEAGEVMIKLHAMDAAEEIERHKN